MIASGGINITLTVCKNDIRNKVKTTYSVLETIAILRGIADSMENSLENKIKGNVFELDNQIESLINKKEQI